MRTRAPGAMIAALLLAAGARGMAADGAAGDAAPRRMADVFRLPEEGGPPAGHNEELGAWLESARLMPGPAAGGRGRAATLSLRGGLSYRGEGLRPLRCWLAVLPELDAVPIPSAEKPPPRPAPAGGAGRVRLDLAAGDVDAGGRRTRNFSVEHRLSEAEAAGTGPSRRVACRIDIDLRPEPEEVWILRVPASGSFLLTWNGVGGPGLRKEAGTAVAAGAADGLVTVRPADDTAGRLVCADRLGSGGAGFRWRVEDGAFRRRADGRTAELHLRRRLYRSSFVAAFDAGGLP